MGMLVVDDHSARRERGGRVAPEGMGLDAGLDEPRAPDRTAVTGDAVLDRLRIGADHYLAFHTRTPVGYRSAER